MAVTTADALKSLPEAAVVSFYEGYVFYVENSGFDDYFAAVYRCLDSNGGSTQLEFVVEDYDSTFPDVESALLWCRKQIQ